MVYLNCFKNILFLNFNENIFNSIFLMKGNEKVKLRLKERLRLD